MNYTTITINGEKIGLKFGMASFRYLSEGKFQEGTAFTDNQLTEIGIAHILYSGYYNNCIIKDVEQIHDFEFFVDHIEKSILNESDMNQIKNAIDIWGKSEFIKSKSESNAKKKTTRGKK
jgi:hypothetical protein